MSFDDPETAEEDLDVQTLNRLAVVGLIGSFFVALAGLFALPAATAVGFTSRNAFWVVLVIEFLAALGVGVSARKLYD